MWNFSLASFQEDLQHATYDAEMKGHYDWHFDLGDEKASTRKLSVSVQLTDPSDYTGGTLEFMIHRSTIIPPAARGTVVIFPSYLTHRITPVTSGIRKSLVCWLHGPTFS